MSAAMNADEFKAKMIEMISNLLDENEDINKKDFLSSVGAIYTDLKGGRKRSSRKKKIAAVVDDSEEKEESDAEADEKPKKGKKSAPKKTKEPKKKIDGEKRPLNAYQLFVKEQMPLLTEREKNKGEDEEKLGRKDLMKEISELWKQHKEEVARKQSVVNEDDNEQEAEEVPAPVEKHSEDDASASEVEVEKEEDVAPAKVEKPKRKAADPSKKKAKTTKKNKDEEPADNSGSED